jgi:hypothetical protein
LSFWGNAGRRGTVTHSSQREEHKEHREKRSLRVKEFRNGTMWGRRFCRDPSTTRPDAPESGAEEKIGPLRSG